MNDRVLSLLGLMRRASAIDFKEDDCRKSVASKKSFLLLCAADASAVLKEKMSALAVENKVPFLKLEYTKEQLSAAIGSGLCAYISVNDKGFADSLKNLLESQ